MSGRFAPRVAWGFGQRSGWVVAIRILVLLVAVAPFVESKQAQAHGGGTARLVDEPVGPYRLFVWTRPEPIRVGTAHFTVGVFSQSSGSDADEPVLEATVALSLMPSAGDSSWQGQASREESANKLYYEADAMISMEGEWQATVVVSGPAGSGSATFGFEAAERGINWKVVGVAAVAVVALAWWFLTALSMA